MNTLKEKGIDSSAINVKDLITENQPKIRGIRWNNNRFRYKSRSMDKRNKKIHRK